MMGIRVACFVLMVVITPYGWYTWVLGGAAIVLPYIAVVLANVSANVRHTDAENPERALTASSDPASAAHADSPVVQIEETPSIEPRRPDDGGNA